MRDYCSRVTITVSFTGYWLSFGRFGGREKLGILREEGRTLRSYIYVEGARSMLAIWGGGG